MQDKSFIKNSFINDVGFHHIRDWLVSNANCKENQKYFNELIPSYNKKKLNREFGYTEELFNPYVEKMD